MSVMAVGAVLAGAINAQSSAARTTPQPRKGSAETSLIGISLFDTGLKVVSKYGSPDEILGLSIGSGSGGGDTSGGGGGPAAPGGGGTPGRGSQPGAGGVGPPPGSDKFYMPIDENSALPGFAGNPFGTDFRQASAPLPPKRGGGPGNAGGAPPGDLSGNRGGGSAPPPAGGGAPSGGDAGGGAGQTNRVTLTRWVYNRSNAKYSFVLDKFNRVVQIEAIGLNDSRVGTKRGIHFGSNFSEIIKKYNAPDGYEISGTNIVVRYLVMDRVAFKLSKVRADRPHCVTGIVVAAGKQ